MRRAEFRYIPQKADMTLATLPRATALVCDIYIIVGFLKYRTNITVNTLNVFTYCHLDMLL